MRRGEIITAGILALLSIYMMWKSTELEVGYIRGQGPGGGAWPFWLSAIMLICTAMIAYNWVRRTSPPSQSEEPVLDAEGRRMLIQVGGGIVGFVALINIISMYGAMAVFLFYYLWFLGRHSLKLSLTLSLVSPVAFFFFFEGLMRITMPSGMSFTQPVFNLLYSIIY
ncbi:tripartite tricarboxylate transporter TctB family protein [Limibaculum sp. FT325]|uniref:tripartite tricarboxylate transporter TctB family protein n=1 Tax=Thermohalobaculum sediminis TaxID=2939436 RepID=UPI0020C1180A|nr:tripartite tricarboxylate transporter TctB family protein [Limibaculum sediminis]MCL5776728.1 tripartite tricarboxylate transporter TctB family protein [Limibaculum sediminis]